MSRPDLARALGVNPSSASSLVHELIEMGLLRTAGTGESRGGRPAARLEVDPGFSVALGAEISHRGVVAAAVDLGGRVLCRAERKLPLKAGPQAMLEELCGALRSARQEVAEITPCGAGIGIAGVMGVEPGVSREFPNVPGWHDVNVAQAVRTATDLEVEVDNDVRAATLAEFRYGAGRGLGDFVYLHIRRGIAAGAVFGGKLHTGAFRGAGELGHFQVAPDGPVCYCGSNGCLESVASPRALLSQAAEAVRQGVKTSLAVNGTHPEGIAAEELFAAAAAGDRLARNLVERAGESIGRITAGLDNVLDPRAIILGGLLADGADVLAASIESNHRAMVMPLLENTTEFRRALLGPDAAVIGGAALVFEKMFSSPEELLRAPRGRRGTASGGKSTEEETKCE
jgi:predicted NBD/HSP70 family sugar kinase